MKENYKSEIVLLGLKIKKIRNDLKISQQELAYRADVDIRTIQRIEKGEYAFGIDVFLAILDALSIKAKDVI